MRTTKYFSLAACSSRRCDCTGAGCNSRFCLGSKYAGIYSSEAPESTDPAVPAGPAFSVSLGPDGTATVTQDMGKGAITTFGHWTDAGSQITIKFDAVEGKPTDPPMVFQPSHDGLRR